MYASFLAFAFCTPFLGAAPARPQLIISPEELAAFSGGSELFSYRYAGTPYKPYIKKLYSPGGLQVLRDAPPGHRHHHGLMYAITVNGVNFWEEQKAPGAQEHVAFRCASVAQKPYLVFFSEELRWLNPRTKELLLLEKRSVGETRTGRPQATLLTWTSAFTVPPGLKEVTLTGSHYHDLGMRFLAAMDRNGTFMNETGDLGPVYRGTERLGKAAWCTYTARGPVKTVTVGMFGDPDNARGKPLFFTMTRPFAYLSATLGLHKDPLVLKAGKSLTLTYGVVVWDGEVDRKTVESLYKQWLRWISENTGKE